MLQIQLIALIVAYVENFILLCVVAWLIGRKLGTRYPTFFRRKKSQE